MTKERDRTRAAHLVQFRLIHLLAFVTLLGVILGIGTAYGWQASVAACGFGLLAAAIVLFQRSRRLASWAVWLAFAISFGLPALYIMSGNAAYGWQAVAAAAVTPFETMSRGSLDRERILSVLWLLALTLNNLILLFCPLVLRMRRLRITVAVVLCVGTIAAWMVRYDSPDYAVGFYLWASSITIFTFFKLLDLRRSKT